MSIHSKCIRFFLLPTVLLFVMRLLWFLDIKQTFSIITSPDGGDWRIGLFVVEIIFYISLYYYIKTNRKVVVFYSHPANMKVLMDKITEELTEDERYKVEFKQNEYGFEIHKYTITHPIPAQQTIKEIK